ncbi:MAG TPA: phosphotransferase [Microbacterium sp.]|nr:phosphotransferase [Microbacterium sp.]
MDSTLAALADWMPRQRWYAARGGTPSLRLVAAWDLPPGGTQPGAADGLLEVRTLLVADEGAVPAVLYQVPIVARATTHVDAAAAHLIGSPEPGTTLVDGVHDPAYAAALLRLVTVGGEISGPDATGRGIPAAPRPADEFSPADATVLTGEQSNTSLIYRAPTPVICKVYRQLHAGLNPDIELQTALAAGGSPFVPRAIGSVEGTWPNVADSQQRDAGSLAFAQEYLPDVEDAWRVALRAAAAGEDFDDSARELGRATAQVHLSLAELFRTREPAASDRAAVVDSWHRRLSTAIAEVPELADRRGAIEAVYARAAEAPWPHLQRIHGDYHLGQVIRVPGRGWMLLDFEGEPMRPMAERVRPDLALRDVAGMLRSFDYVAGSIRLDQPERSPESVRAWALSARTAFLEGYERGSGSTLADHALLDALELDKAVYEALYETRSRPTWVAIPLRAIGRLA